MGSIGKIKRTGNLKPDVKRLKSYAERAAKANESIEATARGAATIAYGTAVGAVGATVSGVVASDDG